MGGRTGCIIWKNFIKSVISGRKPAIFWLVFFSYMCIINMYESVRQVHKMDYTVLDLEMTGLAPKGQSNRNRGGSCTERRDCRYIWNARASGNVNSGNGSTADRDYR